jgi:AcrR family transcriptional regulator
MNVSSRPYEQRARADAAEETRRRILDAVHQRLRDAPAQPVSIDQVGRIAGVARSTVYLIFGSRAGLFEAFGADLWNRTGLPSLTQAVGAAEPRDHLRGAVRASVRMFLAERDVYRALFSMAALDAEAVGGMVTTMEDDRAGGVAHLVRRLSEADLLRQDVTVERATHVLWLLTSFDAYDLAATGSGLAPDQVADLVITIAERALLR